MKPTTPLPVTAEQIVAREIARTGKQSITVAEVVVLAKRLQVARELDVLLFGPVEMANDRA